MSDTAEYYKSILDNLTGGLVSIDMDGEIIYINPTAGKILHMADPHQFIGRQFKKAFMDFPALCDVIIETLKTHKTVHRSEVSILHGNTPLIIGYSTLQVKNGKGTLLGIAVIFQDITFAAAPKKA
ncbi:MAG: PAS domain-containing protein [bacterium]